MRLLSIVLLGGLAMAGSCTLDSTTNPNSNPDLQAARSALALTVAPQAHDTMAFVMMTITPGTNDGAGTLRGYTVYASGGSPFDSDSLRVAPTLLQPLVVLGPYRYNTTQSGTACVVARRARRNSSRVCVPWRLVFSDVAPPPPILRP